MPDLQNSSKEMVSTNIIVEDKTASENIVSDRSLTMPKLVILSKSLSKSESTENDFCTSSTEAIYSTSISNPSLDTVVSEEKR